MAALDGLRILDMTQYEAGTSCTQALAWLGADVVKVEAPDHGDPGRASGLSAGYSPYFCAWNANKKSVAIDLRTDAGKDLFLRLLPGFDIVVENFAPGVVEKLRLGYHALRSVHPTVIHGQIKGFGNSGPQSHYKSFDAVAQAAAGAFSLTGEADGPPLYPGTTIGDSGTGVQLAMALLAAYVQRLRTGEGQHIEISMQEAVTYYVRTRNAFAGEWGAKAAPRNGNEMGFPPIGLYPCSPGGSNDWIFIFATTPEQWDALCVITDNPEILVDERFIEPLSRLEHKEAFFEILSAWTQQKTKFEAMTILAEAGVPCSAVLDTKELHEDEHLNERGFIHHIDHPAHGRVPLLGFAPRLSKSSVPITRAPLLGEHTREVLAEELAMNADELDTLQVNGVIGDAGEDAG